MRSEAYGQEPDRQREAVGKDEPLQYTDIGHGMGGATLWIAIGKKIQTAKQGTGTHESIWGMDASMSNWRGRYEPETARVSVAYPMREDRAAPVPGWLIKALAARFGDRLSLFAQKPHDRYLMLMPVLSETQPETVE